MKSNCFGRGRPIYDGAWLIFFVNSPFASNEDINRVSFNPSPPNPPHTDAEGFLVAYETGINEYSFVVQNTQKELPRISMSRQFERHNFVTTRPLRFGDSMHFMVNGDDLVNYTTRPQYPNACSKNSVGRPPVQGDQCLLARPWVIEAPEDLFEPGDILRENDTFMLVDAYSRNRLRRYLSWREGGKDQPGQFVLTDREHANTYRVQHSYMPRPNQQCNFQESEWAVPMVARPLAPPEVSVQINTNAGSPPTAAPTEQVPPATPETQ
jgi:hypothetical protein